MHILLGIVILWAILRVIGKAFRGVRDIVLLLLVIAYSGAHMPTSDGFAHIGESFKAGYARGVAEHDAREREQN